MSSKVIHTPDAPEAIGPYVQARIAGNTLYTSGCVAINPHDGSKPEDVKEQAQLCLKNLGAILAAAGYEKSDVVKTTVFLLDMEDFAEVNKIYAEFFGDHKPCRSCVQAGRLPAAFKVEIEAIAVK